MNYEKAYKEALEKAKSKLTNEVAGDIFPELKESEDERMWNKILNHFDWSFKGPYLTHEECDEIKDFLEKHKEQKPLSTEETELNSLAFLEQMGYTCIPPGKEYPTEWSEKDEEMRLEAIKRIDELEFLGIPCNNVRKVLESFRSQSHIVFVKDTIKFGNLEYERGVKDGIQSEKSRQWKLSKEQMEALWNTLHPDDPYYVDLSSLYDDLKKLL